MPVVSKRQARFFGAIRSGTARKRGRKKLPSRAVAEEMLHKSRGKIRGLPESARKPKKRARKRMARR